MRRVLLSSLILLSAAGAALAAQETGGERGPYDTLGPWKIVNTLIFAALVGYFIYKKAPAFFSARSADIQKAIREATGLKMTADLRYSEIDRKMATLAEEVKKMRNQSDAEMALEHQRRQEETAEGVRRIQANADAQIQAFRQAGTRGLRSYATDAALDQAAKRIQERAGPDLSEDSVHEFTKLVERGRN